MALNGTFRGCTLHATCYSLLTTSYQPNARPAVSRRAVNVLIKVFICVLSVFACWLPDLEPRTRLL